MTAPELLTRVLAAPAGLAMNVQQDPSQPIWSSLAVVAMGAQPEGGPIWVQLAPFALILGIFYFVILAPMRKRQKKVAEFQDSLKVGDKVVTTSGLYGTVAKVGDASVQLKIAEKVNVEVTKASVAGYQGQDPVVPEQGAL
jgi:preprotein translocase subunit YajC